MYPKFHYADLVTQVIKVHDTNHVADFHDLCPQQSHFIAD